MLSSWGQGRQNCGDYSFLNTNLLSQESLNPWGGVQSIFGLWDTLAKKLLAFYGDRTCNFHNPHLNSMLSQLNPVHTITSYFFIFNEFIIVGICARRNYVQKWITKLCKYSFIVLAGFSKKVESILRTVCVISSSKNLFIWDHVDLHLIKFTSVACEEVASLCFCFGWSAHHFNISTFQHLESVLNFVRSYAVQMLFHLNPTTNSVLSQLVRKGQRNYTTSQHGGTRPTEV
jgi:hypothetical protein